MRIALILAAALLATPLCAEPEFRLVLADGTVLSVDTRPEVRDGAVSFVKGGMGFTLPLARVDQEATARANDSSPASVAPSAPPSPPGTAPAAPPESPRRFTDEDLPSRAAPAPPQATARKPAAETPGPPPDGGPPTEGEKLSKWSALAREEEGLSSRVRDLDDQIRTLEDRREALDAEDAKRRSDYGRYPTDPSVVAAAQYWAEEYERRRSSIEDDLTDLRSKGAEVRRTLREVQLEMRDLSIGP